MVRITPLVIAIVGAALLPLSPRALAQQSEPSARERELAELVRQLNERVTQLEKRLGELEPAKASSEAPLTSRVDELEKSIEEIRQGTPPSPDSKEWAQMRKTIEKFSAPNTMRTYWQDGLRLDSNDGSFKLKIGGRIQHDWAFFDADGRIEDRVGELDDGTEFRRARLYLSGTIYDNTEFKLQFDFADGDSDFKDVYLGLRNVPVVGSVRVGHFKEPFSLEELTSSNYITFMERSLVTTFAPARNTGIMLRNHMLDKRMTWAAGFFRDTDDFGEGSGGRNYNVTARLTGLPWYEDKGEKLLHLGVAYTHKNFEDDMVRFRARPEAHLSHRFVDTGDFSADFADIIGVEAASVLGPFSVQGEFVQAFLESRVNGDPAFWAASLQASYFLTGEHRPYKRETASFSRVKPLRNYGEDGGWGAWEVGARYSYLDLNDAGIDGGRLRDFTLGLNWYLNPNIRMMWNYILADAADRGDANIFQWRFQLSF